MCVRKSHGPHLVPARSPGSVCASNQQTHPEAIAPGDRPARRWAWIAPRAILIFLLACQAPLASAESNVQLRGHVKSFFSATSQPATPGSPAEPIKGVVRTPLRIKVFWPVHRVISFDLAYECIPTVRPTQQTSIISRPNPEPTAYRVADLPTCLYPSSGTPSGTFGLTQSLDRISISIALPQADLYIGRQAIAFGSARVINPTDVLAPFVYEALDTEERLGIDAVRVRKPLGLMGELDAGIAFGDDFAIRSGAAFFRTRMYLSETDVSLMAMAFQENLLLGVDLARAVVSAGAYIEAAQVWTDTFNSRRSQQDYFRLSMGIDYNFSQGIYTFAEYHLNTAGSSSARDYLTRPDRVPYTEGGVYLYGRHYLSPGLTYQATPLLTVTAQALINLTDGSAFLAPSAEYSAAENVVLAAGLFYGLGRQTPTGIAPESEFGLYPRIYHTSFRFYF